jgi:tripartite-type tricarboxylate transporter receptor subunit TctC
VKGRLTELGAEPIGSTPEQFSAHVKAEIEKWGKVIREAKVELQ